MFPYYYCFSTRYLDSQLNLTKQIKVFSNAKDQEISRHFEEKYINLHMKGHGKVNSQSTAIAQLLRKYCFRLTIKFD